MKIFDLDIGIGQSHLTCQQKPVCIYSLIYYIKICELHCKFKDVKFDNGFSLCFILSLHFRVWLHIVQEQKWSFVLSSREYSQKLLQQSVPLLPKVEQKKNKQGWPQNNQIKSRWQKWGCVKWRNPDQVGKSLRWTDICPVTCICWHPQAGGGGGAAQAAAALWSGSPPRARRPRCSGTGWGSTGPVGSSIMAGLVTHWQDGHVPWSRHAVLCHLECPRQCCDPLFRMVYQMTNSSQQLYYMIGQFDGWLLGPEVGLNYGGIKNTHDGMCVQSNPG